MNDRQARQTLRGAMHDWDQASATQRAAALRAAAKAARAAEAIARRRARALTRYQREMDRLEAAYQQALDRADAVYERRWLVAWKGNAAARSAEERAEQVFYQAQQAHGQNRAKLTRAQAARDLAFGRARTRAQHADQIAATAQSTQAAAHRLAAQVRERAQIRAHDTYFLATNAHPPRR
jgi:hypothetical protein